MWIVDLRLKGIIFVTLYLLLPGVFTFGRLRLNDDCENTLKHIDLIHAKQDLHIPNIKCWQNFAEFGILWTFRLDVEIAHRSAF